MKILLLLTCLIFLSNQSSSAQIKTDLEVFNLKGKVKTLRTERTKFTYENGIYKEGKSEPQEQTNFDDKGYYTERIGLSNYNTRKFSYKYFPDGKIKERADLDSSEREVFSYENYRVINTTQLADGHILDKWIYYFDEKGNKLKEEYFLVDKNLGQRLLSPTDLTVYKNDSKGRLFETSYYKADGTPTEGAMFSVHRYENFYNNNQLTERTAYKLNNNLVMKWTFKYNEKGLLEEVFRFGSSLIPLTKVVYLDFDELGNWKKCSSFKVSTNNGKTIFEPTENEYRTIVYYP